MIFLYNGTIINANYLVFLRNFPTHLQYLCIVLFSPNAHFQSECGNTVIIYNKELVCVWMYDCSTLSSVCTLFNLHDTRLMTPMHFISFL